MIEARYALILGHNRVDLLRDTFYGIVTQVDMVWIHDNASDPPLHTVLKEEFGPNTIFIRDSEQPPNLARFWNNTLDQIELFHDSQDPEGMISSQYKVAVLTDDLDIPAGWFDAVSEAMDRTGAAAGCTSAFPNHAVQEILKREPDADIANRMYGPAYILRGGAQIRANEDLRWWFNDTDMDWKARKLGGMINIPGPHVHNKHPNESTVGVLAEQAGRDREAFKEWWGWVPW